MADRDHLLKEVCSVLTSSFRNAIVWEQKDPDLLGSYVYIKYEGKEIGVFIGYLIDAEGPVRACITFFFAHPSSKDASGDIIRLFYRLLIRFNLRLRTSRYKIVSGRSPAMIRIKYFNDVGFSADLSKRFFKESIQTISSSEPIYKAVS